MSEENKTPLLEVKDLKKWFPAKSSPFSKEKVFIKAVDGVSFTLNAGETLGVVGESGCGKSITAFSIMGLLPKQQKSLGKCFSPTAVVNNTACSILTI